MATPTAPTAGLAVRGELAARVGVREAVTIDYPMEDAATVEISRMQAWHRVRPGATNDDGTTVTSEPVRTPLGEEADRLPPGRRRAGP